MIKTIKTTLVLAALFAIQAQAENGFTLQHDLTSISIKDSKGRDRSGGIYTQMPSVTVGYESDDDSEIHALRVAVKKCDGMVAADGTFTLLHFAVEANSKSIDITTLSEGETAQFDVSVPGRYSLGYCAVDEEGNPLKSGLLYFDSLYDDGNWTVCGEAELSSGVLSSENVMSHTFDEPGGGYDLYGECPLRYPYYSGETWTAPIEYNVVLKKYRIVNPFTCNPELKDYVPEDEELPSSIFGNVEYYPEAFIFDREHPAWFLINAEYETRAYCEPMRTGIAVMHAASPYSYIAKPYAEKLGNVIYDVCPRQDLNTGKYADLLMADDREATLIVTFPGWTSGIDVITEDIDNNAKKEYYTVDGVKVAKPGNGFYIVRQGASSAKKTYLCGDE